MNINGSKNVRNYAEAIVESGQLGKSELYQKLFLYLVDASLKGEPPKEIDIALDVFGKDESFNVHEDSIVRVYIHSLRGKLDEYYRRPGRDDDIRIQIPKGGYRVVAVRNIPDNDNGNDAAPAADAKTNGKPRIWLFGALALLLAIAIFGDVYFAAGIGDGDSGPLDAISKSFVWSGLLKDKRPITIILGDVFFYTELDPELGRQRLIGDVPINSRDALRAFLKDHPDRVPRLGEFDTTFLTKGEAYSLATVMPILRKSNRPIKVAILDELDVADIRNNDIIFVGPLHRLGPLADYYSELSHYRYEPAASRLVDKATGASLAERSPLHRDTADYGTFAMFNGPTGNLIMIFGMGGTDVGLLQVLRNMTSSDELDRIGHKLMLQDGHLPTSFEVVFGATGYERTDLSSSIIDLHPLKELGTGDSAGGL